MTNYMCVTCGTQFSASQQPPERCPICDEPRQYVGPGGQRWTTLEELRRGHDNVFRVLEPGVFGIGTTPSFAIGQRALLVQTSGGNVLWDCISLLDEATIRLVQALGGIRAIAISHPHFYGTCVEWSQAFGGVPVYIHAADRQWVMRPSPKIVLWESDTVEAVPGLSVVHLGGHFDGGTVLLWEGGAEGRGALLAGDILQVVPDRRYVSFMYSYPNLIPLPAPAIQHIERLLAPHSFDRIYGAWWERIVDTDGKACVERSAARYLAAIGAVPAESTRLSG